jgi:hypothetical protein
MKNAYHIYDDGICATSIVVRDGQDNWTQGERRLSHDVPWVGFLVLQRIIVLQVCCHRQ